MNVRTRALFRLQGKTHPIGTVLDLTKKQIDEGNALRPGLFVLESAASSSDVDSGEEPRKVRRKRQVDEVEDPEPGEAAAVTAGPRL